MVQAAVSEPRIPPVLAVGSVNAVNMLTDYNTCLERNAGRDRKVPEEVIERMSKGYTRAKLAEGWDKIRLVLPDWMEE